MVFDALHPPFTDEGQGCSFASMAGGQVPGPLGSEENFTPIDEGTLCRATSPAPGPICPSRPTSSWIVEQGVREFEAEGEVFALVLIGESSIRLRYAAEIRRMSTEIMRGFQDGELTAGEAARLASDLRNEIFEAKRALSSPLGRAYAESLKTTGKTLEQVLQEKAAKLFSRDFTVLSEAERNSVYLAAVESAGKPRQSVMRLAGRWGKMGRGLAVISVGIAVYNVWTAEDKVKAVAHEGVTTAGGMLGGAAGGAAAGLVCGLGAPICVTIGIFVGGALGALGVDVAFNSLWH